MSVEPEVQYRPEGDFPQEVEIPAETCEGGSGTVRPTTDTASQYTTADKPEIAASSLSRKVTTSSSITPQPLTSIPHIARPRDHASNALAQRDVSRQQ